MTSTAKGARWLSAGIPLCWAPVTSSRNYPWLILTNDSTNCWDAQLLHHTKPESGKVVQPGAALLRNIRTSIILNRWIQQCGSVAHRNILEKTGKAYEVQPGGHLHFTSMVCQGTTARRRIWRQGKAELQSGAGNGWVWHVYQDISNEFKRLLSRNDYFVRKWRHTLKELFFTTKQIIINDGFEEVLGEGEEVSQRKHWRTTRVLSKRQTYLPDHTPEFWADFGKFNGHPILGFHEDERQIIECSQRSQGVFPPSAFPHAGSANTPRGAAHWLEPPFPMIIGDPVMILFASTCFWLEIANSSSVSLGIFLEMERQFFKPGMSKNWKLSCQFDWCIISSWQSPSEHFQHSGVRPRQQRARLFSHAWYVCVDQMQHHLSRPVDAGQHSHFQVFGSSWASLFATIYDCVVLMNRLSLLKSERTWYNSLFVPQGLPFEQNSFQPKFVAEFYLLILIPLINEYARRF